MGLFPKERDLNQPPAELKLQVDGSFFRVKADELSVRLDQFLGAHLKWRSRTSIQELIHDGYVHVDAATPDHPQGSGESQVERRPGRRLRHGSRVVVVIPEEHRIAPPSGPLGPLHVLYEDDDVLAVDKPPLVTVHPSGRHVNDTLIQRVHAYYKEELAAGRLAPRLGHRLDRETSGVVLIGKHARAHTEVRRQFEAQEVEKTYLALVWGELEADEGSVRFPIGPARASRIRLKMTVSEAGLDARTDWRVVERRAGYTLLECAPVTGRQHQIRVHLAAIGHAVVGDKLYGPGEEYFERASDGTLDDDDLAVLELPRHALHNHRLVFRSPGTRVRVAVESPLAPDLVEFLESPARTSADR